jgi:hypothetical protein
VFDAPFPPPMHEKRRFDLPMAAALALSPEPTPESHCVLDLEVVAGAAASGLEGTNAAAELLDSGNPVRFILPLLERMHRFDPRPVILGLPGGAGLKVTVSEVPHAD